jgi:ATP-binding cassette, subfamily B, multidrug efflux pump
LSKKQNCGAKIENNRMKSLSYLNKYLLKYKWRLILGIVFITASNLFQVEMPKVVKNAVNSFLGELSPNMSFYDAAIISLKMGGLYVLLSIGKGFFLFLTRQTIIITSRLIEFDLKNEIYNHYQRLNFAFFKKNSTGDLMNRISEDVSQVRMYLGPGLMYTINLVILFIMAIITMLNINVSLTLIVLAPLPIMSILIYKVSTKMNQMSKHVQEEQSRMSTIVQETFSGIRVIKAYLREKEMKNKFDFSADETKNRNMKLVKVNALFMPTIVFLIGLSTLLAIYYGGILTYSNEITPGDIVAFIFYVNMLTWPFASVGWVTSINQRAAASQERINEFLKVQPEIVNTNFNDLTEIESIAFQDVYYTHPNSGIEALKGVSFEVKKGETIGIVGKTGSGKSTILNLLSRQLDSDQGEVLVNGKSIKSINLDEFREKSGVVPQDVFLFSDSIRNNLLFGTKEKVSEEELIDVCKKAHVYHNITQFEHGFDTVLGERGVNISGGQKQRISIARALIRKPEVLVLDDCLSAVDTETEEIILNAIHENVQTSITIIVSHRISSLRYADRILVLDNGKIVEQGTHENLLASQGIYFEMYQKQLIESGEE